MEPLLERLRRRDRIIGDGALGTLLGTYGLQPGTPPERWVLDRPEVLAEIASRYLDAGAELITTATFGGAPLRLAQHRLADRFEDVNRRAVRIVRAAVGDGARVAGDIGPTGLLLEPLGDARPGDVEDGYARQVRLLADEGVDVILVETMTDLQEALLAVRAARREAPAIPVFAMMTFEVTPRGAFTIMGVSVRQAAAALADAGAAAVGANCGTGVADMVSVAREFRACATVPLMMQPNAGLPASSGGRIIYRDTPAQFAEAAGELIGAGVSIVGGCCGTTPEHIRALRDRLAGGS